jgi:hypothetical protein
VGELVFRGVGEMNVGVWYRCGGLMFRGLREM